MKRKVFVIGFHKTGTRSLAKALRILGYSVTGPNEVNGPDVERKVHALAEDLIARYDAFHDNPWPIIYPWVDKRCPGSKFILTVRDTETWLRSQLVNSGRDETPMRKWIYGAVSPKGNEDVYRRRFERHNHDVVDYFSDRPGDLLVMDFARGDGWKELCPFLGRHVPNAPFPYQSRDDGGDPRPGLLARLFGRSEKSAP